MRTRLPVACLLSLLLVTAGACTKSDVSNDVASIAGSTAPSATPTLSLLEQGIRWSRCMRAHGVPQPDPVAGNGDGIRFEGVDKDAVDAEVLRTAQDACEEYRPVLPPSDMAYKMELTRQFARCMRDHGVTDFPDPETDGHFDIKPSVRNDPRFLPAKDACEAREDAAVSSRRGHE